MVAAQPQPGRGLPARRSRGRAQAWFRANGRVWTWWLAGALVLVLALGAGTLVGLRNALDSERVARWVVDQATAASGGALGVEGVTGTLRTGLAAKRLRWSDADVEVSVEAPAARWPATGLAEAWDLATAVRRGARPRIVLTEAGAEAIEVRLKKPSGGPPELPSSLALPFDFEVGALRIGTYRHRAPGNAFDLTDLRARAASDASRHELADVSVAAPWGRAGGGLVIATAPPFGLRGRYRASGTADDLGLELAGELAGELREPRLTGELAASRGAAQASMRYAARLTPFAPLPLAALALQAKGLDLRDWRPDFPHTRLDGRIDVAMTSADTLVGTLALDNAESGPVDRGGVPVRRLEGEVELTPDRVVSRRFKAIATRGDEMSGEAAIAGGKGSVRLATRRLAIDQIASRAKAIAVAGEVTVEFDGPVQRFSGRLAQGGYELSGRARREGNDITAEGLALASPYGRVTATGRLNMTGALPFAIDAKLAGFNPADFGDFPVARLSGTVVAEGRLDPEPQASVRLALSRSSLRGEALEGNADLRVVSAARFDGRADLAWAGNRLRVEGRFGEPGDRLAWEFAGTDVARIDARIGGALSGKGTLTGSRDAPVIEFVATAREPLFSLEAMRFRASGLEASGTAELVAGGRLDIAFDARELDAATPWITGRATGRGRVHGVANAPRVSFDATGITLAARIGEERLRAARLAASGSVDVAAGNVLDLRYDVTDLVIDRSDVGAILTGRGTLRGPAIEPAIAFDGIGRAIRFDDGDGAGRAPAAAFAGSVDLAAGGEIDVRVRAPELAAGGRRFGDVSVALKGTRAAHALVFDGRVDGAALGVSARGNWPGGGRWSGEVERFVLDRPVDLQLLTPVQVRVDSGGFELGSSEWMVPGGRASIASVRWRDGRLTTAGRFDRLDTGPWVARLGEQRDFESTLVLAGSWDLSVAERIEGRVDLRRLSGDLQPKGRPDLVAGLETLTLAVRADAEGLRFEAAASGRRIGRVQASASTRIERRSGAFGIASNSPVTGSARAEIPDLGWLDTLLPGVVRIGGSALLDARVTGSFGHPVFAGELRGSRLEVKLPDHGLAFGGGSLAAHFEGDRLVIDAMDFSGAGGTVEATGQIVFAGGRPTGTIAARARGLRLLDAPDRLAVVSGNARIALDGAAVRIAGKLSVDEGRIDLPPAEKPVLGGDVVVVRGALPEAAAVEPARIAALDLDLDLGERFTLRGRGIDTLLRGSVKVVQRGRGLTLQGTVRADGGTYFAYGRRLELARGNVVFSGPIDNPNLDIVALRRNQDVEAGVSVSGPMVAPRIRLVSIPEVPDTEKLSWLVLGHGIDSANKSQASLLQAAALAMLSPADGSGLQAQVARLFGLDQVSVGSGGTLQSSVLSVGKQITHKLYATIEQGLAGAGSLVKVNYAISKRWTLTAQTGSENAVDLFYTLRFD